MIYSADDDDDSDYETYVHDGEGTAAGLSTPAGRPWGYDIPVG